MNALKFGLATITLIIVAKAEAQTYKWRPPVDGLALDVVTSVTVPWQSQLPIAAGQWSAARNVELTLVPGKKTSHEREKCTAVFGKVRVCNFNWGATGWRGQSAMTISGGYIVQSVSRLNEYYFQGTNDDPVHRRRVLCHELGHAIGLDHTLGIVGCMNPFDALFDPAYQVPSETDYQSLSIMYATPAPMPEADPFALMRSTARVNGHEEHEHATVEVEKLNNGDTQVRVIHWAK